MRLTRHAIAGVCLAIGVISTVVNNISQDNKIKNLQEQTVKMDSTLKSWSEVMNTMTAEANAKKAFVASADSIEKAAMKHKIDSLNKVLANLKKEGLKVAR